MDCNVNLWAVLVSGIVASAIGMLWYSPLVLGNKWMKEAGVTPTDADKKNMWWFMLANLVSTLITIFILARLAELTLSTTVSSVLALAVMVWIGFIAMSGINAVLWEKKSWSYYFINMGYSLVVLLVSGVILALWK
jgi:amino acid transporter